ncbi:Digeranylgeranylglycerophospholipid reductase [uncultured archaeon]|nr:Digeranylgeranylglycerophospholipid reductase [uncultured archaeon]
MKKECDVLVVGAGPAGSMSAKIAAEGGLDVINIEKDEKIGSPVRCAEAINKDAFQDTGIPSEKSFINQEIDGTKIYFYNEEYFFSGEKWRGFTLDRKIFDKYLSDIASEKGANIYTGATAKGLEFRGDRIKVKVGRDNKNFDISTKIVIGADGFEANVGRWANIRKPWKQGEYAVAYELLVSGVKIKENNYWHVFFGEEFPSGYGWVFPKGKNTANIGVAVAPGNNLKKALVFLIQKYLPLHKIIGREYTIEEIRGGGIPTCGPLPARNTIGNGIILVGDSAGIVEPITGEGIVPSMLSGIAAGETSINAIRQGKWKKKNLLMYRKCWEEKRYIGAKLGEDLESTTKIKDDFYRAFSDRKVDKAVRSEWAEKIRSL